MASTAIYAGNVITHCNVTTYNPCPEQCNADYLTTANGTKIDMKKLKNGQHRYVAISRDMLWLFPYGSIIEIEGHGRYEIVDTMNARYNHCIDILQHKSQKNFKEEKVKITLVKKGDGKIKFNR